MIRKSVGAADESSQPVHTGPEYLLQSESYFETANDQG